MLRRSHKLGTWRHSLNGHPTSTSPYNPTVHRLNSDSSLNLCEGSPSLYPSTRPRTSDHPPTLSPVVHAHPIPFHPPPRPIIMTRRLPQLVQLAARGAPRRITPPRTSFTSCRCISSTIPRATSSQPVAVLRSNKNRRRGYILGAAVTAFAGATAVGWIDGTHKLKAVERATSVGVALMSCIAEYVYDSGLG